jgi:hypothetical protein
LFAGFAGQTNLGGSSNTVPLKPTAQSRVIPSFELFKQDLGSTNMPVVEFIRPLILVTDRALELGHHHGLAAMRPVNLDPSLAFESNGQVYLDLSKLITGVTADTIGSRRLPPRWVSDVNGVTIYGLPDGSTVTVGLLGENTLNAVGSVRKVPTSSRLRQSLLDSGIEFSR